MTSPTSSAPPLVVTRAKASSAESPPAPPPWPASAMKLSVGLIFAVLMALSAAAWVVVGRQSGSMFPALFRDGSHEMVPMSPMGAGLFIAMWVTMMVAMMFPSVAPMVVMHWRFSRSRNQGPLSVPVFAGGYLVVWSALGLAAFAAYRWIVSSAPMLSRSAAGIGAGVVLAAAGAYQLSRFKTICLKHCRGPMQFLFHFKPGLPGAARMGVEHGAFCVGCCWGLMAVMFVVGLMNLAWMGVIAGVIFVEKITPFGEAMSKVVGVGLIAVGIVAGLYPVILAG